DNALLVPAYLEAYQITGQASYAAIARETLDYLRRDMRAPAGGYYAAEDAGEVDKEGEVYILSWGELAQALSEEEFSLLQKIFPITEAGNFEHGKNIFHLRNFADRGLWAGIEGVALKRKLLELRAARTRPHRDEKILASWNGLTLSAFS